MHVVFIYVLLGQIMELVQVFFKFFSSFAALLGKIISSFFDLTIATWSNLQ